MKKMNDQTTNKPTRNHAHKFTLRHDGGTTRITFSCGTPDRERARKILAKSEGAPLCAICD